MNRRLTMMIGMLAMIPAMMGQDVWEFTLWTDANSFTKEAVAPKVDVAPNVDGIPEVLWDQATWNRAQYWTVETNANNNPTMTSLPTDTTDHYMEWKAVWTDSAAYFLIHVVDDVVAFSNARTAWWRQDGIEFYPYGLGMATGPLNRNDSTSVPWVNLFPDPTGTATVDVQQQDDYPLEASVLVNGANVFYEIKLPNWTNPEVRGAVPVDGDTMMMAMMLNESDNTDPAVDNRDMKITWAIQGEARLGLGPDMGYIILDDPNAMSIADRMDLLVSEAFPNPFSGKTTIRYELSEAAPVHVTVYDLQGRLISETTSGTQPAGQHQVVFDGSNELPGVYVYRIQAGDRMARGRMVITQ